MIAIFKSMWGRRWLRWSVWAMCIVIVLLEVTWETIDWAGAQRLADVREMLAKEGETLDMHAAAADAVPDERNFFAIPLLKDLAAVPPDETDTGELRLKLTRLMKVYPKGNARSGDRPKLSEGVMYGEVMDLKACADWLRKDGSLPMPAASGGAARDVLAALSADDAVVNDLAAGLSRPESQWTPAWKTRALPENPFMVGVPQYQAAQSLGSMLALRCAAAASAGEASEAQKSALIAVRIDQSFVRETTIIGVLVGCGQSLLATNSVWELCNAHCGSEEDFHRLQEALEVVDFRAEYLCAERGEMAGTAEFMQYLNRTRDPEFMELATVGFDSEDIGRFVLKVMPSGYFDANAAAIAWWHFNYYIKPLRDIGLTDLQAKQGELDKLMAQHGKEPYKHLDEMMARVAIPSLRGVSLRVIYSQCLENEAIAACALERYRIEHGSYPDSLDAANRSGEKPVPLDLLSGKPMGYRRTTDGRYALWCVGFDGKDDGGKRVYDEKHPEWPKINGPDYLGDWVWDYPGK